MNPSRQLPFTKCRHWMLRLLEQGDDPYTGGGTYGSAGVRSTTLHKLIHTGLVEAVTTYKVTEVGARQLAVWNAQAAHDEWLSKQGGGT